MNYLIVRPKGQYCELQIVPEDTMLNRPFESWALLHGRQILYCQNSMHRDLKQNYLWGSFQKGASYAVSYEDMQLILHSKLGPSDRQRFQLATDQCVPVPPKPKEALPESVELSGALWAAFEFALQMTWGIVRLCGILLLVPILLHWINKRRH
jgi:hypothetical protein